MVILRHEKELIHCFRPQDRDHLERPSQVQFPYHLEDHLSWVSSSGHQTFLVVLRPHTQQAIGLTFRRPKAVSDVAPKMCNWCHRIQGGSAVGLMTTQITARKSVGLHLCRDLNCKKNLLEKRPSIDDLRETVSEAKKLQRLQEKMTNFINRNIL